MRWIGNYALEWMKGPWPDLWFIRHGHGFHQLGYEMEHKLGVSPRAALEMDIPNHLVPLTPLGRWQSDETGDKLLLKPDVIYASQILRAIETAERIFPGYNIRTDPRLNEKDFGPAHMRSVEELTAEFPWYMQQYKLDGKYFASKAPGAENYIDMYMRLHSFLDTLRRDWAGKCVAICCHSAIMLTVRQLFERYSPRELLEKGRQEQFSNCSILHYQRPNKIWGWRDGKFRLELARPPFRLWEYFNEASEREFHGAAIGELPGLRAKYPIIQQK